MEIGEPNISKKTLKFKPFYIKNNLKILNTVKTGVKKNANM